MPLLSRTGRIADPIHGYVYFTGLERVILGHRVSQRLRYISQNGLAHLVYPEARTSRFAHSLGAMHLVPRALSSALRNTSGIVKSELLGGLRTKIQEIAGVGDPLTAGTKLDSDVLLASGCVPAADRPLVILAEQALRLAALFHDLGHLPFSHDFEFGLEDYWLKLPEGTPRQVGLKRLLEQQPGRVQVHEHVGHVLSWLLLRELFDTWEPAEKESVRMTFELAQAILDSTEKPRPGSAEAAIQWLHSLIDGEIDVDRCDYVLRDGRNHGFEFVNYDLNRLLDHLVVAKDNNTFVTAVKPQGLSAAESFILSRYLHYKYGIRQHKVVQIGAALRVAISKILASDMPEVAQFLDDLEKIPDISGASPEDQRDLLRRFAGYDDTWWMTLMRKECDAHPDEWLELVCWRKDGPKSLWKRIEEFPGSPSEFNGRLPKREDLDAQKRWQQAIENLKNDGILVARHDFRPWRASAGGARDGKSVLCMRDSNEGLKPITDLSPIVRGLRTAWAEEVQVHAFAKSTVAESADGVFERLKEAVEDNA